MTLEDLKKKLSDKELISNELIIFLSSDTFIPNQYIAEIANQKHLQIQYIDTIKDLNKDINNMFEENSSILNVMKVDDFEEPFISNLENIIIVCKSIKDIDIKTKYKSFIMDIPKIEQWELEGFAKVICPGLSFEKIKRICSLCQDANRLNNELTKINIFEKCDQEYLFDKFISDNMFSDLTNYSIFSFCDALVKNDKETLRLILNQIENIDINPVGFITILYKNFKNIADIQLGKNVSAESLGLSPKAFVALRYRVGKFSDSKLISILKYLSQIDFNLKSGAIPAENIIEFTIINVLC